MNPKEKPDATRPAFLFLSPLGRKKERDRQRLKPQIDKIKIGKATRPASAPASRPAPSHCQCPPALDHRHTPCLCLSPIVYLSLLPIWGFSLGLSPSCLSLPPTPEAPTPSHPSLLCPRPATALTPPLDHRHTPCLCLSLIVYLSFLPTWGFSLCLSPSCLSLPPTPQGSHSLPSTLLCP